MKKELGPGTIAFPTPVYIVATYGKDGTANAMNVAWGGVCSSEPPCVMAAIRKSRCTYDNIMERKAFTVNFPDAAHVKEADYFGLISGNKVNKFETAGLSPIKSKYVDAPIIGEFPLALECNCINTLQVGQHVLFIGEIVNVTADENCLNEEGNVDIQKADPIAFDPVASQYNRIGEIAAKAFSAGIEFMPKK